MFLPENVQAQIFSDAADLVEQHGWCRGRLRDKDGCFCAQGAIAAALVNDADADEVRLDMVLTQNPKAMNELCAMAMANSTRPYLESLWIWNDLEDITQRDVIECLRTTAERVANNEQ